MCSLGSFGWNELNSYAQSRWNTRLRAIRVFYAIGIIQNFGSPPGIAIGVLTNEVADQSIEFTEI